MSQDQKLLDAAAQNYSQQIIDALDAGANPNVQQPKTGQTPLMLAVNAAHNNDDAFNLDGIVALITDPRTDLTIKDKQGFSARDHAASTVFQTSIVPAIDQALEVQQQQDFVKAAANNLKQKYRGGPKHTHTAPKLS